jgi:hypothetical protein
MLCNKTYVDAQNSRPKFGINITNVTNGNLSSATLAEFYTVNVGTTAYNITLPTPSVVIAGTTVSFRRIAGTAVGGGNFICINNPTCFMGYSPATTSASSILNTLGIKIYYTLSASVSFLGNFTSLTCDANTWYHIVSW